MYTMDTVPPKNATVYTLYPPTPQPAWFVISRMSVSDMFLPVGMNKNTANVSCLL